MQQLVQVAPPAPVQPPNANNDLSDAVANLSNAMATLATRTGQASKVVQKPAPFKGEQGAEARRFLAGFTMWATAQGSSLNVLDDQGLVTARRDAEWIRSILSYLHDDAAVWASPAMEVFAIGQIPFHGVWAEFCAEFKARFESVNEVIDAKEKLRDLWQGKLSVPEYAARFRELMDRTGYGNDDLRGPPLAAATFVDDCMALSHGEGELQPVRQVSRSFQDVVWTELAWCKFASATGERNVLGAEPDLVSGFEYMRLWFARFEGVLHVRLFHAECSVGIFSRVP
ncbi:hypothetical protein GSI_14340 [Ganoderma sinense ZZ0214-1]|uniref:Retrotransposon gag domain-containing protein n=1 Tax=Ganoderma sinense ZZ0214-1 TaxID=1077348 RepID=A0A2G8RNF3_9APHY|nr:hypothetical protein GSI_14340 [Ganoderma sinense ZZ0214-1]